MVLSQIHACGKFLHDWVGKSGQFASCDVWEVSLVKDCGLKLVWENRCDHSPSLFLSGLLTCPRDWLQMLRSRLVTPRHRSVRFVRVIFRTRNVTRLGAGRDFQKRRYLTRDRIGLDWTWNFLQNIFHRLLGHRNFFPCWILLIITHNCCIWELLRTSTGFNIRKSNLRLKTQIHIRLVPFQENVVEGDAWCRFSDCRLIMAVTHWVTVLPLRWMAMLVPPQWHQRAPIVAAPWWDCEASQWPLNVCVTADAELLYATAILILRCFSSGQQFLTQTITIFVVFVICNI